MESNDHHGGSTPALKEHIYDYIYILFVFEKAQSHVHACMTYMNICMHVSTCICTCIRVLFTHT